MDPRPAQKPTNMHGRIFLRYLRKWSFNLYHLHLSPSSQTATYESEAHNNWSTIDHFIGPAHLIPLVTQCYVGEEDPLNSSDHLPIIANLTISASTHSKHPIHPIQHPPTLNWGKLSTDAIHDSYTTLLDQTLLEVPCPTLLNLTQDTALIDQHLSVIQHHD